jgi:hypothetical protein
MESSDDDETTKYTAALSPSRDETSCGTIAETSATAFTLPTLAKMPSPVRREESATNKEEEAVSRQGAHRGEFSPARRLSPATAVSVRQTANVPPPSLYIKPDPDVLDEAVRPPAQEGASSVQVTVENITISNSNNSNGVIDIADLAGTVVNEEKQRHTANTDQRRAVAARTGSIQVRRDIVDVGNSNKNSVSVTAVGERGLDLTWPVAAADSLIDRSILSDGRIKDHTEKAMTCFTQTVLHYAGGSPEDRHIIFQTGTSSFNQQRAQNGAVRDGGDHSPGGRRGQSPSCSGNETLQMGPSRLPPPPLIR